MKPEEGTKIVKGIVNQWSQIYINQVFHVDSYQNIHQYSVEFSRPHQIKPIPLSTVKVDFYVIDKKEDPSAPTTEETYDVEFNFKGESLRHKLHCTMRKNMFEKWIDRVLENKMKVKSVLHLGTEFEYTRTVDEEGKIVDPFVPKYDLTKVLSLEREIKISQKVNVESPRFINTLRVALFQIFEEADKDNSGYLDYQEFEEAFKNLSYGLGDNDVSTLISLADENNDGKINWEEFVPIGIEAIKTFFARNKVIQKKKKQNFDLNKKALENIYMDEIVKADEILSKKFKLIDEEEKGTVSIPELKKLLHESSFLTPKEINGIIRNMKTPDFKYEDFKEKLFDVRYELAKSRILETNLDKIQTQIIQECIKYDSKSNGKINLLDLRDVLFKSKIITLSPFQIQILMGLTSPDKDGAVNYKAFSYRAKDMIDELFSLDTLNSVAHLIGQGVIKRESVQPCAISNLELFKTFKKYDKNLNGVLEINEYIDCLRDQEEEFTENEIITLGLMADTNGDNQIDYEEFMKHFTEMLNRIRFMRVILDSLKTPEKPSEGIPIEALAQDEAMLKEA